MVARDLSDQTVMSKTGKSSLEWEEIIGTLGFTNHTQIAKFLREKYKVSPWWSQILTNRYEWKKGLRNN